MISYSSSSPSPSRRNSTSMLVTRGTPKMVFCCGRDHGSASPYPLRLSDVCVCVCLLIFLSCLSYPCQDSKGHLSLVMDLPETMQDQKR
ncbi:hypothetical protein BDP55DRAFT_641492 [Colletotrichum godetiae]|uniref:Uncharacterized protein n=1 Tax=Colletotrichum godetiae TaxID=1209918 RepID=A0AAJ0B4C8_9PEZI|nr:uncharacterized protein BDP55DRAFT_641492 [Colletotrichum godetiae]KAK1701409.1 hypothetical protein BDP55DRAFT_641492 [Colletotrichum godetiae]